MKKLLTLTVMCLVAIAAVAQENLAIKYTVSNRDTDSGKPYSYEMVLVANPKKSLYYNTESLFCDSCNSTPEGKAKLHEIQMKAWRVVHPDGTVTLDGRKLGLAPEKKQFLYVAKDYEARELAVYDRKGDGLFHYTEPMSEIEWSIMEDSTKTILGYDCIMAKSNYHGRTWTVWFTTEVPIQDGPWKLQGLPGIILSADGGNDFHIDATEVGSTSHPVPNMYSAITRTVNARKFLQIMNIISIILKVLWPQGVLRLTPMALRALVQNMIVIGKHGKLITNKD